jgi:hypothetical protein
VVRIAHAADGTDHCCMYRATFSSDDPARAPLALDLDRIVETIGVLRRRIGERFPGSGLGRVCATLEEIGLRTKDRLDWVARPNFWLRIGTWLMALLLVAGFAAAGWALVHAVRATGIQDPLALVEAGESAIQEIVFVGVGLVFLLTMESRVKRRRALRFIRELRALAHIVDMHQLTKDPHRVAVVSPDTPSSPERTLTQRQLGRYLDYCSEMLSLASKVSALYAERFDDPVVLQAVDEVEALTSGLARKIWQKIMVLGEPTPPTVVAPTVFTR